MKKYLILPVAVCMAAATGISYAEEQLENCCLCIVSKNYDASCYDADICTCANETTTSTTDHMTITKTGKRTLTCATTATGTNKVTCTYTRSAQCIKGYYGALRVLPTGVAGECTQCPSPGTTAGPGATDVSECYIASGANLMDTTGNYTLTGDCYYVAD